MTCSCAHRRSRCARATSRSARHSRSLRFALPRLLVQADDGLVAALLSATGLTALVALGVANAPQDTIGPLPPRAVTTSSSPKSVASDHSGEWVSTILGRPLFSPDRRPSSTPPAVAGLPGLPRLSGIIVGPFGAARSSRWKARSRSWRRRASGRGIHRKGDRGDAGETDRPERQCRAVSDLRCRCGKPRDRGAIAQMSVRMLMLLALLGSVVGCERAEQPAISALPELPGNPAGAPARVNGRVGAPEATPPAQISSGAPGDVAVSRGVSGSEGGGDVRSTSRKPIFAKWWHRSLATC